MEHVEEAGVHSGDSSCVLPPPSLTPAALEVEATVRKLAPALGVVGLVNVQLAMVGTELYVLEANPRASRTVPFASKAIGVNLVDAACRLAAGSRLADLELEPATRTATCRQGGRLPVRPLPGRRPGPRAGDALHRRGDGERRGLPVGDRQGRARGGQAAPGRRNGVPLGPRFRQGGGRGLGSRLVDVGFELCATAGTAHALAAAGLPVTSVRKVGEEGDSATVVDLVRRRRCDLVVNTPAGRGARSDGYLIREAALAARVPCITTLAGAFAAVEAIARARSEDALSLQERVAKRTA